MIQTATTNVIANGVVIDPWVLMEEVDGLDARGISLGGRLFVVERVEGTTRELASDAGFPIDPRFSPDAKRVACVRDGELYVIDVASRHSAAPSASGGTISSSQGASSCPSTGVPQ